MAIEMRTIFLYFIIVYSLISKVLSWEDVPLNIEFVDKFIPRGSYNPNANLHTSEIIRREGYPSEAHVISTEDDYLITLHRIPGKKNSPPVLLQHGLLGSSADWVFTGPGKSLAFMLADHGYDVWIGNYRGNTYARAHKNLLPSDERFWDFSWHEMALYDLPAMILHITNLKQSNLTYVGFSMGTTGFYAMSSMRPDIASRVQIMFSLAPVAYMSHLKSPLRYLAPLAREIQSAAHSLAVDEFLPQNELIQSVIKRYCDFGKIHREECTNILFIICGYDRAQLNETLIPVIFGHCPAGTSSKTLVHYSQGILSAKFQQFDYGPKENLKMYNSVEPPSYDTTKITVPIALYYGVNDWLADIKDVLQLARELRNVVDLYEVPYPKFNHIDFLWAIQAPELVYSRLLRTLKGS